jgi:hypothetical protein
MPGDVAGAGQATATMQARDTGQGLGASLRRLFNDEGRHGSDYEQGNHCHEENSVPAGPRLEGNHRCSDDAQKTLVPQMSSGSGSFSA